MLWQSGQRNKRLDYHNKSFQNPYFKRKALESGWRAGIRLPRLNLRSGLKLAGGILCISGLFWLVFFSSAFQINNISANVPAKFNSREIVDLARQLAQGERWLLPKNNILIFDTAELAADLTGRYTLSNLKIQKKFPNKLVISFEEKLYEAVWLEAGNHYLVNKDDESAMLINPIDLKDKKIPLIENISNPQFVDGRVVNSQEVVLACIHIYANISNNIAYKIDRFTYTDAEAGRLEAKIANGPRLLFSTRNDLDKQLDKLYTIIKDRLKGDFLKKSYIDLRFNDTVYIK